MWAGSHTMDTTPCQVWSGTPSTVPLAFCIAHFYVPTASSVRASQGRCADRPGRCQMLPPLQFQVRDCAAGLSSSRKTRTELQRWERPGLWPTVTVELLKREPSPRWGLAAAQRKHKSKKNGKNPPRPKETLQPSVIFGCHRRSIICLLCYFGKPASGTETNIRHVRPGVVNQVRIGRLRYGCR